MLLDPDPHSQYGSATAKSIRFPADPDLQQWFRHIPVMLLYILWQAYTSKQLRCFPLNTVLSAPPASGLAFQDLGSEAEDAAAADSSEDDGSSSSGSEDSDAAEETEESASARTPRSRRACVEAKAPPPATPKVEPVQPMVVVEEKKEEEVVEPVKPPARRVDEFRPHAICKVCQVLMSPGKFCEFTWTNDVPNLKFWSCNCNILGENLWNYSFSSESSRVWTWTSFFINSKALLPPLHKRKVLKIISLI